MLLIFRSKFNKKKIKLEANKSLSVPDKNTFVWFYILALLQLHDEVHDNHKTVDVEKYRSEKESSGVRPCPTHQDQPIVLGCKSCLQLFCITCFADMGNCTDGKINLAISIGLLLFTDLV